MTRRALEIGQHGPISVTYQHKDERGKWVAAEAPRRRTAGARTDARYRARAKYRDTDGVVRDVEAHRGAKAAAEAALVHALARRGQSAALTGMTGETRFAEALPLWEREITEHSGVSASSQRVYLLTMAAHVTPVLGALRLREITVPVLTDTLRAIASGGNGSGGSGSAKTARTVLRSFFDLAQRHGAVEANLVRAVPAIRVDKRQRATAASARTTSRAFTREERDALLAYADQDERAQARDLPDVLAFLAGTGVRIGEALAVRWEDVDLDAGEVRVSGTVVAVKGQGVTRQDGGKTDASTRSVALPSWLVERLRARLARTGQDTPAVLANTVGALRDPSNTAHHVRDLLDGAGFPWATSHTFRKTAGTLLTDAGVSIREVANQLGHAKVSTTLDYYQGRGTVTRQAADVL